ncbi:hypothetical protein [Clostridium estertheticum]|nr:hypothetical protein [Clostridium estertheticum]
MFIIIKLRHNILKLRHNCITTVVDMENKKIAVIFPGGNYSTD